MRGRRTAAAPESRRAVDTLGRVVEGIEQQLKGLPAKSGVYLFRGERDDVLYVGKAKSLRPRVRSYFQTKTDGRPGSCAAARADPPDRGDRHRHRGRGAPPGAEPRQAPPAAVQRAATRRQVVPVHRRHRRRRVPAGDVHAGAPPPRGLVLRPLREREEGARDARRAQPRLPVPALRGAEAGPAQRDPVPRLPHRALHGALRRLRLEGGLPRDHRRRDRVPLRRDEADPARAGAEDDRGGGGRALRGGGAVPQPALLGAAPRRAAGRGQGRGRDDRRDRDRGRGRPRGRAGVPAPRRQDGRPARLPPRERGRPGPRHRPRGRSCSSTTALRRACRRRSSCRWAWGTRPRWPSSCRSGAAPASRCACRSAARSGGSRSSRGRTRGSRWPPTSPSRSRGGCGASRRSRSCARRSTSSRCRCGSSASTSRRSRASRSSARWSSSRTRSRRRRTTASSACARSTGRTTSQPWPRSSRAASRGCRSA